jgi:hypothetical protein
MSAVAPRCRSVTVKPGSERGSSLKGGRRGRRATAPARGEARRPAVGLGGRDQRAAALGGRGERWGWAGGRGDDETRQPMGWAGSLTQKTGMGSAVAMATWAFWRSQ